MAGGNACRVIQVTNIAPQATRDQMQTLFGHIGKIEEIRLYPTARDVLTPVQTRICYVKYSDSTCVQVAQHLTNTVFIDRALIVIPVLAIPDEYRALEMAKNGTLVPGLHKAESKLPSEVVNRIEGQSPQQVIKTYDPKLEEKNLPEYPALPAYYDARKVEEIRRTILVCDVPDEWRLDDLMECFQHAGEVKYARWAEKDGRTYCMIEFCEQPSIIHALKMHGQEFKGGVLNVYHSTDSIVKPEAKSNEAAQQEIEDAMAIVKEAQNMISAAIDPVIGMLAKEKRVRSRSRSRERRTSRARSHRSRSKRRSRSRNHRRSRSKSSKHHCRSHRSRSRRRSLSAKRSHSRRKSRSRSHSRRSRTKRSSRSVSRTRSSRSRGHSHSTHKRSEDKYASRSSRSHTKRRTPSESPENGSRRRSRERGSCSKGSSRSRRSRSTDRKLKTISEDDRRSTR